MAIRTGLLVFICAALLPACTGTHDKGRETASVVSQNELVLNRGASKDEWWHSLPRPSWQRQERVDTPADQGWFEVYRVAEGVYAIYEPGQFEEVISYLITGEDRALLFDTGLGIGDIHSLVSALTDRPVTVLNSHSHYDHIGGNHHFEHILATDTDYTAGRARGLSHEAVAEFVGEGWIWKPTPAGFDPAAYRTPAFEISGTVKDGEIIDLGRRRLEILLTPGHAPDSLCLLEREKRMLFTGDTFYPAPLYAHLEGSDFRQYLASAERLAALATEIDILMPAHNEAAVDSVYLERMAEAFRRVAAGSSDYMVTDGSREYRFEGFSLIVDPAAVPLP